MRILILGSGAREHAIAWKLKQEIGKDNIYIAPGNAGTQMCGTNIDVNVSDFESLKKICLENNVDIVLPGSEEAIANGLDLDRYPIDRHGLVLHLFPDHIIYFGYIYFISIIGLLSQYSIRLKNIMHYRIKIYKSYTTCIGEVFLYLSFIGVMIGYVIT